VDEANTTRDGNIESDTVGNNAEKSQKNNGVIFDWDHQVRANNRDRVIRVIKEFFHNLHKANAKQSYIRCEIKKFFLNILTVSFEGGGARIDKTNKPAGNNEKNIEFKICPR